MIVTDSEKILEYFSPRLHGLVRYEEISIEEGLPESELPILIIASSILSFFMKKGFPKIEKKRFLRSNQVKYTWCDPKDKHAEQLADIKIVIDSNIYEKDLQELAWKVRELDWGKERTAEIRAELEEQQKLQKDFENKKKELLKKQLKES